ncbi:hypothetical protein GGX14DRAFT_400372 [Mycena pura]|uniref:Uncharacterized protein n=1 Tax=Mycena pura TaxID=153505 RepID=A0AAD6V9F4_9AGAR|nr:hypothetical protein GGX14DRAFT_400372 [Mycena pura]
MPSRSMGVDWMYHYTKLVDVISKAVAPQAALPADIWRMRAYRVGVFKVTVACTVVVFAVRQMVLHWQMGTWMGWWSLAVGIQTEAPDEDAVMLCGVGDMSWFS